MDCPQRELEIINSGNSKSRRAYLLLVGLSACSSKLVSEKKNMNLVPIVTT